VPVNIKFLETNLPKVGSGKFDKPALRKQFEEQL
jgi:acyl-CoA synthetase (AMP-forming)/AMP-acid ligase II